MLAGAGAAATGRLRVVARLRVDNRLCGCPEDEEEECGVRHAERRDGQEGRRLRRGAAVKGNFCHDTMPKRQLDDLVLPLELPSVGLGLWKAQKAGEAKGAVIAALKAG